MIYKYKQVLLVDDEELDKFILQKLIQGTSFSGSLVSFNEARQALHFLKNVQKGLPDVIFVDLNIPLMNGFQFLEQLIVEVPEAKSKCKLVVLTNSMFEADEKRAKSILPSLIFMRKPLTAEKLNDL